MTQPADRPPPASLPRSLADFGYDAAFRDEFEATRLEGDRPGRVLRAGRGTCLVALGDTEAQLELSRELGADHGVAPTTGDFVVVRGELVAGILARRTALTRASPDSGRGPQVLAANVDLVLVVEPLGERFRPRRLERLLVLAWGSGALPVLVLSKADRCDEVAGVLEAAGRLAPGVSVHAVSPLSGEGMERLAGELAPRTTSVVIGRSGAGKSTLANALSGGRAGLATTPVRADDKGRHTTVTRELVQLANGALLIDTPGVRSIGLTSSAEAIAGTFGELEALAASCRFGDCGHRSEPGCAVKEAIAAGELDPERLESHRRFQLEQEWLEARGTAQHRRRPRY